MLIFLIGLAVLGGVTSQSMMDVATAAVFLFLIKDLYKKNISRASFKPIGIEWAFIGYFAVAVIGLIVNGKPPVPWFFYISKFNWVLNLYIFIYAFNRTELDYEKYLKYFCIAYTLPNLYAVATYFPHYDFLTKKEIPGGVVGLVDSATYHAHGNSLIFVFFTAIFIFSYESLSTWTKRFSVAALLLMGASIFFSFTRGIWGATFVTLLLLLLIKNRKWAYGFVASCFVSLAAMMVLSEPVYKRVINTFIGHTDGIRAELIHVHLEMFKAHPFIGIGYWESYRQIADYWPLIGRPPDYFESHAHNQIVSVLANTGLLGMLFFASISFFFFRLAWNFYRSSQNSKELRPVAIACLMLIIQFFLACFTDVTFEYAKIRGILIIGLAALVSFSSRNYPQLLRSNGLNLKRFFDAALAFLLLVILSPLLFVVSFLILILDGRPILFTQARPGQNEKIFKIFKFRTMRLQSSGQSLPDHARMTKIGSFIRKTSLDELPQLLNVLRGELSLVGPRPLLVQYLPLYNETQKKRHLVAPGITGWAQINGRNAISWEKKFAYDVWYVENWSLFLDIKIMFLTFSKIFKASGVNASNDVTMEEFKGSPKA